MTLVCRSCTRVNPPEARYCYHDGVALGGAQREGPIAVGAQPFLSPFVFPSGRACRNFDELVLACDSEWEAARDLLREGYLESFLGGLGRADLALAARQSARAPSPDRGLDDFLNKLPSGMRESARLSVQPLEVNLGQLSREQRQGSVSFTLHLENQGMGLLHGSVVSDNTPWLALGEGPGSPRKVFQFRHDFSLPVQVLTKALRAGTKPLEGRLLIESNGGTALIVVRCEVPVRPFPEGALAGARTPRQVAERAKASPREAAVLFEKGAVAAWYESNGWTYPVQGPASSGLGAVQQFFEALGLVTPPRVEISEQSVHFRGAPGTAQERVLQVQAVEKRPVFAHASSGVPWLTVGRVVLDGRTARIPLRVPSVPDLPGEHLLGQVQVTANGNQRFTVDVALSVSGRPGARSVKPGGAAVLTLDDVVEEVPVLSVDDVVPANARASEALPVLEAYPAVRPAVEVLPVVEEEDRRVTHRRPEPRPVEVLPVEDEDEERPRRRSRHLWALGAIALGLLGVLVHDLLLPSDRPAEPPIDPDPYISVHFHDGPKEVPQPGKKDPMPVATMRFGLVMLREKDPRDPRRLKRLTFDEWGRSNNTCVRIDGQEFLFGELPLGSRGGDRVSQGSWVERAGRLPAAGDREREGVFSVWQFPVPVQVRQEVKVIAGEQSRRFDTCLVRYTLENKDARPHAVGIRFMLDTFIGANDGVPFTIPGATGLCDTKARFGYDRDSPVPDFIQALEHEDLSNPGTVANVQFRLGSRIESPTRVTLGGWPNSELAKQAAFNPFPIPAAKAQLTMWDVPDISMKELQQRTRGAPRPADADSAVTMYWDDRPLGPGERREVGFAYGLGSVSSGEGGGRLLLAVGGRLAKGSDFTLTALVHQPQPGEKLLLDLPAGLSLAEGRVEQDVPAVPPGAARPTSPVTWRIRADRDGSYKVTVRSSSGASQSQPVTIRSQGVFD